MSTTADRPRTWAEYIGQNKMKARLDIHIKAARATHTRLDHILLTGPPGAGKTSIAALIAERLGYNFEPIIMPIKSDVLMVKARKGRTLIFLDELHRLAPRTQEELLPVLEDGYFQRNGSRLAIAPRVTFIGATTEPGEIIPPLYDRFVIKPMFETYTSAEMTRMLRGMATRNSFVIKPSILRKLAVAANGVPRNGRSLVMAAKSLYTTRKTYTAADVLDLAGVTPDGLSEQHLEYLRIMASLGGRAGLSTMCAVLRLHPKVVNEMERVLVEKELMTFRSTGRELLPKAWDVVESTAK